MNTKDLVIATITLARNKEEETLLRKSLTELSHLDIPVFITDGGSGGDFIHFLHSFPHFHISNSQEKGVWPQARKSLLQASATGKKFILYTEPDKSLFFTSLLRKMLKRIEPEEQTGIILASRSALAFSTFPNFQQMTETTINDCCEEIFKKPFDYTYGPFILNSKIVSLLTHTTDEIGWGWRPMTFGMAMRSGLKLESFIDNFRCPENQQHDTKEERLYRMKQLSQNMEGILLSQTLELPAAVDVMD